MYKQGTLFNDRALSLLIIMLLISMVTFAHFIIPDTYGLASSKIMLILLRSGYKHVFVAAKEHVAFMISIFLLSPKGKPLLWQMLLFTIADLIVFSLSVFRLPLSIPLYIIDPFFAVAIIFACWQNLANKKITLSRYFLVLIIAVIHSLGLESNLKEISSQEQNMAYELVYNIGVELGQLTVILLLIFVIAKTIAANKNYRKMVVIPCSILLMGIATFNLYRIFFLHLNG